MSAYTKLSIRKEVYEIAKQLAEADDLKVATYVQRLILKERRKRK